LLFTEFGESAPAAPGQTREVMVVKKLKRREWTAQEVREVKSLARQKTPATQIARKLKRTEGATRQKALTLNVSLNSRPSKRKSPK
jgi:hypothetical protein